MLFKILHGDQSRISLDVTPFHEGWAYVTHDGYFYIDLNMGTEEQPNNQRLKLNAGNCETLVGKTWEEIQAMIPTKVSDLENDAQYITADALSGLGGGDMLKATYDTDGDGVVDNAEKLGGVAASEYAKKTDIPTVPTKVSAFTNDAGYLTSYTEIDPTVPSHVKGITIGDITNWNAKATTDYVDTKVAAALGDDPNFATTVMTEIGKKVDKTTTVNGHALSGNVTVSKSDVGLGNVDNTADADKSVLSATKLATARNINGVAFDGTSDVTVYSPQDFAPLYSSLSTAGWYRIAEIAANNAFSCRLDIGTIYVTTVPEVVTLNITKRYGTECNITQINHAGSVSIIPKIRAVQKSGETWYLEMYYDKNTSNAIYCSFTNVTGLKSLGIVLGQHLSTVNFTAGEIPEGYTATEFELSENPIKASAFEGALKGNADTATKATNDEIGRNIANTLDSKSSLKQDYLISAGDGSTHYYKLLTLTPTSPYIDSYYEFDVVARTNKYATIRVFLITSTDKYISNAYVTYDGNMGDAIFTYVYKDEANEVSRLEVWGRVGSWNTWCIFPKTYRYNSGLTLTWDCVEGSALPTDATTTITATPHEAGYATSAGSANTATKVSISETSAANYYPVMFESGGYCWKPANNTVTANPSTGALKATNFEGNATSAKTLSGGGITTTYDSSTDTVTFS